MTILFTLFEINELLPSLNEMYYLTQSIYFYSESKTESIWSM